MPMIISTPEEWFREEERDLHLIRPTKEARSKKEGQAAKKELYAWFADNLANTSLGVVGPSERHVLSQHELLFASR